MNAFPTADEAAAYRMLKQVLQNHVSLQEMSILATSMACTGLLGDRCLERYAAGTTPPEIVAAMLDWLKHGVRERQTAPTLPPFGQASAQEPEHTLGSIPGASMTCSGSSSMMSSTNSSSHSAVVCRLCSGSWPMCSVCSCTNSTIPSQTLTRSSMMLWARRWRAI